MNPTNRWSAAALLGACVIGAHADEAVGVWVEVTPTGLSMDHTLAHGDNYGVQDVLVNPLKPAELFAFSCFEGVWKSSDYGATWSKISADGGPLDHGKAWGEVIAPDASYMLACQGDGPEFRSAFRSTDGGVTWTAHPTPIDPYMYDLDPHDGKHVVCSGHGSDHLAESKDGGLTWSDAGVIGSGGSNYLHFLDSTTLLSVAQNEQGTWRGTRTDAGWNWVKVSGQHHVHGSHQLLVEHATPAGGSAASVIYNPGDLGIERSVDGGLTWTSVSKVPSNVIIATPSTLYAGKGFPAQHNSEHQDPRFQRAGRADGTAWSGDPTPAGMINGPKCMAVTRKGTTTILVTGNWFGGLWRYVEPAAGAAPAQVTRPAAAGTAPAAGDAADTIVGAPPAGHQRWEEISAAILADLQAKGAKVDFPGMAAGVSVDPANGDVFLAICNQGIWCSKDHGASFARCDAQHIGGRCETGAAMQWDPSGGRLACFMLDGTAGMTCDGGRTWTSFAGVGRGWDFGAVDWSAKAPQDILALHHESGGELYRSSDAGRSWTMVAKDAGYDAVGLFDATTLIAAKRGDGIQRSVDNGRTWTKVAGFAVTTHVMTVVQGVGYLLAKEGLVASADHGATWTLRGAALDATFGPLIHGREAIAWNGTAILASHDAGATWSRLTAMPDGFQRLPNLGWNPSWYTMVGWDAATGILYASHMGHPAYRWSP